VTPPRRDSLDAARRRLDEAAGALDGMRLLTGAAPASDAPGASTSERVRSEALAAVRDELRRVAGELEAARARGAELLAEVGRLREELAARPTLLDLEEARLSSDSDAARRASELAGQVVGLKERVSLLSAEHVRLETLRRKAETSAADAVASRKTLEETLRRDLLAAHAALDRAAAESGIRDAKAVTEIGEMRKRLDQALNRLHREDLARKQASAEEPQLKDDLEAAQAVIAALRRDLSELRAGAGASFKGEFEAAQAVISSLRAEASEHRAAALGRERALELRVHELERGLSEAQSSFPAPDGREADEAEYPPLETALEPGWARLIHLVKPPLLAAYGHLRRLSAGPMSAGQRAILRLTGSSLSQAADSLATIELALSDSPATTETSTVLPVLEAAVASWEPVFRRRGIALGRDFSRTVPDSPHDPEQLRLAVHHVLRNALEALPRGASVRVQLRRSPAGSAELEFSDDGPGYPFAWLERRFEPFASPRRGHAGLGLAAVRRALRRWGGDAEASNIPGRGARLILAFAAAPPRPAAKP
jgi:signal transduction histidine kinase